MRTVCQGILLLLFAIIGYSWSVPNSVPEEDVGRRSVMATQAVDAGKTLASNGTDPGVWGRRMTSDLFSFKPEMFRTFYIFLGISFLIIFFILFRMFRLRSHRAERKYGVQGDRSAQELTHLPSAIEEDESELEEDETLFDINKTRVYVA